MFLFFLWLSTSRSQVVIKKSSNHNFFVPNDKFFTKTMSFFTKTMSFFTQSSFWMKKLSFDNLRAKGQEPENKRNRKIQPKTFYHILKILIYSLFDYCIFARLRQQSFFKSKNWVNKNFNLNWTNSNEEQH